MAHPQDLPQALKSGQVIARFGVRMTILLSFAAFGGNSFGKSLAALMWMAIVFSSVVAIMKRERPFAAVLNNWDETIAYGAVFALVSAVNNLTPP